MMTKILLFFLRRLFQMERTIYCITGCRIELPMHKAYYKRRKMKYNDYLTDKNRIEVC